MPVSKLAEAEAAKTGPKSADRPRSGRLTDFFRVHYTGRLRHVRREPRGRPARREHTKGDRNMQLSIQACRGGRARRRARRCVRRLRQVLDQQHPVAQGLQGRQRRSTRRATSRAPSPATRTPSSTTRTSGSPTSSWATATTTCTSRRERASRRTTPTCRRPSRTTRLAIEKLQGHRPAGPADPEAAPTST